MVTTRAWDIHWHPNRLYTGVAMLTPVLDTSPCLSYDPSVPIRIREEIALAHSKTAMKRWRQSIQRRDRNRSVKSRTRTLLTKALSSIDADAATAEAAVRAAVSALDDAAQKGVIHANAAARGKSRLLKRFNLAAATAVAAAASAAALPEKAAKAPRSPRRPARAAEPKAEEKPVPKRTVRARAAAPKAKAEEAKPATRSRTRKT